MAQAGAALGTDRSNSRYLLELESVTKSFGGVRALDEVDLRVAAGEIHGVIGPNGAGKSTLFNVITGLAPIDSGRIVLRGDRVDRFAPHRRAANGIGLVFQSTRLFSGMTILENVAVGAHVWTRTGFLSAMCRAPRHRHDEREIFRAARQALQQVGLADWADRPVEGLPLGQQRALQLARALCGRPTLLLLDEPAAGLRSGERQELATLIGKLPGHGVTAILVEHDVAFVSSLATTVTVLDLGQVIAEGTPTQVRENARVRSAYLGDDGTAPRP